jgi:hypothetical protein
VKITGTSGIILHRFPQKPVRCRSRLIVPFRLLFHQGDV